MSDSIIHPGASWLARAGFQYSLRRRFFRLGSVVAVEGKFGLVYGTSASAPVIASMLTMINDARTSRGKKVGRMKKRTISSATLQLKPLGVH